MSNIQNELVFAAECQIKSLAPNKIVEWIPYSNLQNINYLTKGGCSEIYTGILNKNNWKAMELLK
ncbi:hypothetical protein C1645_829351 [Glomus cerebriforme]|uniref:Serine-threonine/tyrosine-protein kinase catalytic domain-containing protein n=1 Tax=Glomus cerebriforme TaxID=658196 RepID=A0A397SR21_9GLOM|nr:hypothetical protein C1645_829351 [Glomus cerebriforme]